MSRKFSHSAIQPFSRSAVQLAVLVGFWFAISCTAVATSAIAEAGSGALEGIPTGECDITASSGGQACTFGALNAITSTSTYTGRPCITACYDAVKSTTISSGSPSNPNKAQAPIDVFGSCRYVDNISATNSLFVPFRTQMEWQAFYTTVETSGSPVSVNLSTRKCTRPFPSTTPTWSVPILPALSSQCSNPAPATIATPVQYQPANVSWPATSTNLTFPCYSGATRINATAAWLGQASIDNAALPLIYTGNDWQPVVNYGPDLKLLAATGAQPPSTSLTVLPGTHVTLTWATAAGSTITQTAGTPSIMSSLNGSSAVSLTSSSSISDATWLPDNPSLISGSATIIAPLSGTATYTITATGSNGVTSVATVTINIQPVSYSWGVYGACSVTCGGGTETRSCDGSDGSTDNDPSLCGGSDTAACNPQACVPAPACGSAANVGFGVAPSSGLCSSGNASGVSSGGNWSWSCANTSGSVDCSAPITGPTCPAVNVSGFCDGAYLQDSWVYLSSYPSYVHPSNSSYDYTYPCNISGDLQWIYDAFCNSGVGWGLPPNDPTLVAMMLPGIQSLSGMQNCTGLLVFTTGSSPLKVSLAGKDARMNSTREMGYRLTNRDGSTFEGYATGSLNEDEAWLMINRDGRGFFVDGFLNGDNWFGDHDRRYSTGFEDLAMTFRDFVKTDENGDKYLPLPKLSDKQKTDILHKRQKDKKVTMLPSLDLQLLDVNNGVHYASDYFDRIYVGYDTLSEADEKAKNFILQRSKVRLTGVDNEYRAVVDQWNVTDMPTLVKSRKISTPSRSHIIPAPDVGGR